MNRSEPRSLSRISRIKLNWNRDEEGKKRTTGNGKKKQITEPNSPEGRQCRVGRDASIPSKNTQKRSREMKQLK